MVIHDKVYDVTSFVDEHPYVPPIAIATSIHPLFPCGRRATGRFSHRESLPLIARPTGQLGLSGPPTFQYFQSLVTLDHKHDNRLTNTLQRW
jgi:hypothetical protein